MDEQTRNVGLEWAMGIVLEEVKRRGLVPLVLICGSENGPPAILPCAPGADPEQVRDAIGAAYKAMSRGQVEFIPPRDPTA